MRSLLKYPGSKWGLASWLRELLEVLKSHKGKVILSGYESPLYDSLLKGWHKEFRLARSQTGRQTKEVAWLNYQPQGNLFNLPNLKLNKQ